MWYRYGTPHLYHIYRCVQLWYDFDVDFVNMWYTWSTPSTAICNPIYHPHTHIFPFTQFTCESIAKLI